jgi:cellulose synthase/poly-beta-1,6-N-acetylglucosamine synthase-like glycosyltransferase
MAVCNEEQYLARKLTGLAQLDYPKDQLEVIVVSDGSTDSTNAILESWNAPERRIVVLPRHCGKATALNHGVVEARGEIVVFTDARQMMAPEAVKNLVADFADPAVGCVSGELIITGNPNTGPAQGMGIYWKLEKKIRYWEGLVGSVVGATGAFYAIRKALFVPLPKETILDDVYIPLQIVRQGQRVVFEPLALASDDFAPSAKQEFRRKVRTLVGNYQLLKLVRWVLTRSNPVRFQFVCHKLLRLFVPLALIGLLVSALWLRSSFYEVSFLLQVSFYLLATLSAFRVQSGVLSRLSNISFAFIVVNAAAAVALFYFVTGREVAWGR